MVGSSPSRWLTSTHRSQVAASRNDQRHGKSSRRVQSGRLDESPRVRRDLQDPSLSSELPLAGRSTGLLDQEPFEFLSGDSSIMQC
jgi:hypothetical protein